MLGSVRCPSRLLACGPANGGLGYGICRERGKWGRSWLGVEGGDMMVLRHCIESAGFLWVFSVFVQGRRDGFYRIERRKMDGKLVKRLERNVHGERENSIIGF